MRKSYTIENMVYGAVGQKWEFNAPKFQYKSPLVGGAEAAHRIAKAIIGALKRTKGQGLDNLARANMAKIIQMKKMELASLAAE